MLCPATPIPMKNILKLLPLLVLAVLSPAQAAFESARFDPANVMPSFPAGLRVEGVTRGEVIVALSVSAEGRVTDSLVLGYTRETLADRCREVMADWRFTPAQLDGAPVPTQFSLQVSFTLEGAVISGNFLNHFFFDKFDQLGDGALSYRLHAAGEIDHQPGRVNVAAPKYAKEADRQGVRGKVRVYFYIDEQGRVRLPSVESVPQLYLAQQAVDAIRAWRFEPPTSAGQPVLVAASQEFEFGGSK